MAQLVFISSYYKSGHQTGVSAFIFYYPEAKTIGD